MLGLIGILSMDDNQYQKITEFQKSIFDDRSELLAIYPNLESNAKFVIDKIWSNSSFFTTITTALIALSVTLAMTYAENSGHQMNCLL